MADGDFYQKAQDYQPFRAYRFVVRMATNSKVVGAFTQFSGVKASTQMAQIRMGSDDRGVKDNYPGITEYQHVTFSKGVIGSDSFIDWLFTSTAPGLNSGPQQLDAYKNLEVVALTDEGKDGMVWTLKDCIPCGYQLEPFDANQSTVMVEQLEFAITGVERSLKKNINEKYSSQKANYQIKITNVTPPTYTNPDHWYEDEKEEKETSTTGKQEAPSQEEPKKETNGKPLKDIVTRENTVIEEM